MLVLWLEPNVRETGEMQHHPEAIASTREVVASYLRRSRPDSGRKKSRLGLCPGYPVHI